MKEKSSNLTILKIRTQMYRRYNSLKDNTAMEQKRHLQPIQLSTEYINNYLSFQEKTRQPNFKKWSKDMN